MKLNIIDIIVNMLMHSRWIITILTISLSIFFCGGIIQDTYIMSSNRYLELKFYHRKIDHVRGEIVRHTLQTPDYTCGAQYTQKTILYMDSYKTKDN